MRGGRTLRSGELAYMSSELVEKLEALLFVASSPVSAQSLAGALSVTEGQVEQGLELIRDRLNAAGPLQLISIAGGYQLCTKPEFAEIVAQFLKPDRSKLSRALLEVLAVVAYQQPITIGDIDAIRGVASEYSVRALVERRLIRDVGRKHAPGRPVLYGTTQQFLHQFNMNDLADLPKLEAPVS